MNLEKSLKRWAEAGLISEEQSGRIISFERDEPSASWVIYGLSGLGVVVALTGIISVIAANWYEISPAAKLILYFISIAGLGLVTHRFRNRPGVVRESLFSAFGLYVLAGIGLTGQIYHLRSDGYQALFFWLAIILPVTLNTRGRLLNNLWFIGLITAVSIWIAAMPYRDPTRIFYAAAIPYLVLGAGYGFGHILPENFARAGRLWSYAVILTVFAVAGNFMWVNGSENSRDLENWRHLAWIMIGAGGLAAVLAALRKIQPGSLLSAAIFITIGASLLLCAVPVAVPVGRHEIIGCALFIAAWGGAATVAAAIERKRLFDLCALVIGIRFVVIYFEVFGSLAATGIGLIISGGVILGTAYLWHKYRGRLARTIREAA